MTAEHGLVAAQFNLGTITGQVIDANARVAWSNWRLPSVARAPMTGCST